MWPLPRTEFVINFETKTTHALDLLEAAANVLRQ